LSYIKKDFHPQTSKKAGSDYRLLLMDGHNSHFTYPLLLFAQSEKILIVCLPAHTTHVLQPCDVGVFGPLAAAWRKQVTAASAQLIKITPYNFLGYYAAARVTSVTKRTSLSAFRETGINPLNPSIIPKSAFAPALNTTAQAAPTVSLVLDPLLEPVPTAPTGADEAGGNEEAPLTAPVTLRLVNRPERPGPCATLAEWQAYGESADSQFDQCKDVMSASHARQVLVHHENGTLRQRLHNKRNTKRPRNDMPTGARHMTGEEVLGELAVRDFVAQAKEFGAGAFKRVLFFIKVIQKDKRLKVKEKVAEMAAEEKREEKRVARERRQEEAAEEKRRKDEEKAVVAKEKAVEKAELAKEKAETARIKAEEKLEKARLKEEETALKKAHKTAEKARRDAEKEAKQKRVAELKRQKKGLLPDEEDELEEEGRLEEEEAEEEEEEAEPRMPSRKRKSVAMSGSLRSKHPRTCASTAGPTDPVPPSLASTSAPLNPRPKPRPVRKSKPSKAASTSGAA
jgi:hypothetical protein